MVPRSIPITDPNFVASSLAIEIAKRHPEAIIPIVNHKAKHRYTIILRTNTNKITIRIFQPMNDQAESNVDNRVIYIPMHYKLHSKNRSNQKKQKHYSYQIHETTNRHIRF